MTKAKTNKAFNIYYFNSEGEQLDQTQIDENNEELAWMLFEEFGHTRQTGDRIEVEQVNE